MHFFTYSMIKVPRWTYKGIFDKYSKITPYKFTQIGTFLGMKRCHKMTKVTSEENVSHTEITENLPSTRPQVYVGTH